ncbi:MAG TPA: efflux transporter outer membrane subunit [Myxococcales bacterium]|nr:efflux transporter outer membrane subunit [Myxococcales bacterium]
MPGRSAALWLAPLLAACPVGPSFVRPAPPVGRRYLHEAGPQETVAAEGARQRFEAGAQLPADWWRLFRSAKLDALVAASLAHNQTLAAAQASLSQSDALLKAGYGVFFPQISGSGSAAREEFNPKSVGLSFASAAFNLFSLSASVSYALDVFGGERRQVEALGAQVDLQRYEYRAAYLALTGNVVETVAARAGYRAQLAATRGLIEAEKEQVALGTDQARAGVGTWASVLSLESQLAATQATLPPLQQKIEQAEHLLAVLAGGAPADFDAPAIELADLALPADVPVTLPADMVRRRPDVLAAEAQLHAANAQIGVATAAMLPRFSLNPSVGLENGQISSLFSASSVVWNLGASLTAPLFAGGTLWFQRKAAVAARTQALASYRQTVLSALEQVADALRALANDAELLDAEGRALRAAEEGLQLTQANYRAGVASYLQVLTADGQLLQARLGHDQAVAQRLQDTAALFVALGGGWR